MSTGLSTIFNNWMYSSKLLKQSDLIDHYIDEINSRERLTDDCLKTMVFRKKNHDSILKLDELQQKLEKAENHLTNITNKWRALIDLIPDIIFVINEEGRIKEANLTFLKETGIESFDLLEDVFCFNILENSSHTLFCNKNTCPRRDDYIYEDIREEIIVDNKYLKGHYILSINRVDYIKNGDKLNCLIVLRNLEGTHFLKEQENNVS